MVRTPCAPSCGAPAASQSTTVTTCKKKAPSAPPEMLPACLDGCRHFVFEARKVSACPGKNAGSWKATCKVKIKKKIVFNHKWNLVFGAEDDAKDRDAECLDQLRNALAECWHRVTRSPKSSCLLDAGRDFSGERFLRISGDKRIKKDEVIFTLNAIASCAFGDYARRTAYSYHSEADAKQNAATALLCEISNTWACATRTKAHIIDHRYFNQEENDDPNDQSSGAASGSTGPAATGRVLNYIRDVYGSGAGSNVDTLIQRRRFGGQ